MAKAGRKPKNEVHQDIQKNKETILKKIPEYKFNSVNDLHISKLIPNSFENVIINFDEDENQTLFLPMNMNKIGFNQWLNRSRGGIFSKDVKNYSLNKKHGKYLILQNDNTYTIARIIENYELTFFSDLNLIDGKIADKAYMIFKTLNNNKKLTSVDRYIEENKETHNSLEDNEVKEKSDVQNQNKGSNKSLIT